MSLILTNQLARLAVLCALPVAALAQATLQISSPADGAAFAPGQTVTVNVRASGATFQMVSLIGEGPLATEKLLTVPPFTFRIQLPARITARTYALTAVGVTTSGEPVFSGPIDLNIDRIDATAIIPTPAALSLAAGATGYLSVSATYGDGSTSIVSQSTRIAYFSETPGVATVDTVGRISALTPGTANISITYAGFTVKVPVTVTSPVTVIPAAAVVNQSQTIHFVAQLAVPNGADPTVTWSLNPAVGSIDGTGVYSAPSIVDAAQTITVTAALASDPMKSARLRSYIYTVTAYDWEGTNSAPSAGVAVSTPAGEVAPGLVLSYNFDEGAGEVVHDLSGNGNKGALTSTNWSADGKLGGALVFDGMKSWATTAVVPSLDLTVGMTLEAWVKPSSLGNWQAIFARESPSGIL